MQVSIFIYLQMLDGNGLKRKMTLPNKTHEAQRQRVRSTLSEINGGKFRCRKLCGQHEEFSRAAALLLSALSKQLQQLDEEVDDVEIERGRGEDVLLWRHFLHDHAHIVDDVEWEQNGSSASQTDVNHSVLQPDLTHIINTVTARQTTSDGQRWRK